VLPSVWFWMKSQVLCYFTAHFRCLYSCSLSFCIFDVQEVDLLVQSVSYCGCYGVVALSVVAVYLNVYVVGR
jgi:hypothetical protein